MVYKYLSPKNLIVTEGLHVMENDVKLRIADAAIMQLLDLTGTFSMKKICGIDRCFIAPEILLKDPSIVITSKADVWSVGVILYIIITGGMKDLVEPVVQTLESASMDSNTQALKQHMKQKFDFKEP